jgi:hypothetical protein
VRARTGLTTTLWGQVRPGTGAQSYRLQRFANGRWLAVGGTARTTGAGYFTRVVRAQVGAQYQVVQLATGAKSAVLTVPQVAPTALATRQSLGS